MPTTRRQTLQYLLTAVGTPMLAASCASATDILAVGASRQFYRDDEHNWLARLCDLIIPDTDTPGALAAGVAQFMDGLMHGWASPATQAVHREILKTVAAALDTDFKHFVDRDATSAIKRLTVFDQQAFADMTDQSAPPEYPGYRQLKQLITRAYFVSEPGAREELNWQLVPGRWDPAVELGV